MPARVHAIIVARPGSSARAQLLRTLDALRSQTAPPAAITLVMCGDAASARESETVQATVEGIIEARGGTSFAEAVELARPRVAEGSAIWLLAHDTAPHPRALERLVGTLERSPSAAIIAPKLVQTDNDREIVSLGVSMTNLGRSVELAAGELDQGQHDGRDDALGSDIRGILIRAEVRDALRLDTALAGADEGLDLGVRARLGGGRVVLAPSARVSVSPDGPAALPPGRTRRAYATRTAQLHRRLAYAPALALPLHWIALLPLALWRSITHLIGKRPEAVAPEWGAALTAMFRFGAVARSRQRIRSFRTMSWASIAPLRVSRAELRRRLDDGHGSEGGAISELHFFSGGGAWVVLAALVASIASFTSLLAWPSIGGGALLPLRTTVAALWSDAAWGLRGVGVDLVGPADPFAGVIAVLGSLWPAGPSFSLVLLWLLALPLAVLGGWFAATRVTDRASLRIFAGVVWALAPTFLVALVDGRPAAVLVHLLLPWLFHAGVVAHRSWGAAGAASVLFAAVTACSPSLAPALLLLWVVALGIVLGGARIRGAIRLLWIPVPALALFAPLAIWQLRHGSLIALLGDPGFVWAGPQASADAEGRLALATGFPVGDFGGWASFAGLSVGPWAAVLLAPLALLALASALAPRWRAGITLLVVALAGLATAFLAVGVTVSFAQGTPVAIWPGAGLSLAWIGVVGAALVTLDTMLTVSRARVSAATVAALAVAVCALPGLTAFHAERTVLTDGPLSTLPAYVAAAAGHDRPVGTLVLTPQNDGGLAADVAWGASETLGAQSTMMSTATTIQGTDITSLAVDLLSARDFDAAAQLSEIGIGYVLLAQMDEDEGDRARALRTSAVTSLNQRDGFVRAGLTDRGELWRLQDGARERASLSAAEHATARLVTTLQLVLVLAALLLSIPTRSSRRAAKARSRIVGRAPEEPLVLPRHAEDLDDVSAVGDRREGAPPVVLDAEPDGVDDVAAVDADEQADEYSDAQSVDASYASDATDGDSEEESAADEDLDAAVESAPSAEAEPQGAPTVDDADDPAEPDDGVIGDDDVEEQR
ncbi:glycosyltransferase family 2 protein [Streptomyces sp. AC495_CC817]|uniref:glycosyltransferase family 2 protein n=1 Tax=Streptomyces sp. AC495_CC817 TaxID=2823900 RepID=UPI001C256190|nr:glycosyltransferase [Streptomyces sp. AC495_CC817]